MKTASQHSCLWMSRNREVLYLSWDAFMRKFYTVFDRAQDRVGIAVAEQTGPEMPMKKDLDNLVHGKATRAENKLVNEIIQQEKLAPPVPSAKPLPLKSDGEDAYNAAPPGLGKKKALLKLANKQRLRHNRAVNVALSRRVLERLQARTRR